jgi:hypothetical protein
VQGSLLTDSSFNAAIMFIASSLSHRDRISGDKPNQDACGAASVP